MSSAMRPQPQDVTIPDDWSGSVVLTIPKYAKGVSIGLPFGSSTVELGVRILNVDGVDLDPVPSGSEGGVGRWFLKFEEGFLSQSLGLDLRHDGSGDLVGQVVIYT